MLNSIFGIPKGYQIVHQSLKTNANCLTCNNKFCLEKLSKRYNSSGTPNSKCFGYIAKKGGV